MSENIKIDPSVIESFKYQMESPEPEPGPNGQAPGPGPDETLNQINEALTFGLKTFDKILKNQELPGLGDDESIELQSELAVIVARRNFDDSILKKSPEFFLGAIWLGALTQNAIAYSQKKKEQPKKPEQQNKKDNE